MSQGTKKKKHYAERDIEPIFTHYANHVSAMTEEGLHDKGEIAAELAHRDALIVELQAENARLRGIVEQLPETRDGVEVVPGMEVWILDDGGVMELTVTDVSIERSYLNDGTWNAVGRQPGYPGSLDLLTHDNCYSTERAACEALERESS